MTITFKLLREKYSQSRAVYTATLSYKSEGKMTMFSDKNRELSTDRSHDPLKLSSQCFMKNNG